MRRTDRPPHKLAPNQGPQLYNILAEKPRCVEGGNVGRRGNSLLSTAGAQTVFKYRPTRPTIKYSLNTQEKEANIQDQRVKNHGDTHPLAATTSRSP